tara:strand:+ start:770 stop:1120 length:351 start_codon:yes stop_codon:yes gene_type:complete
MNEYSIILINGIAYQCQKSKMTLHRPTSEIHDWSTFFCADPVYALIEVKKAKPLSVRIKETISNMSANCELLDIECVGGGNSVFGEFVFETVRINSKGLVSFTAKSSGELTCTYYE